MLCNLATSVWEVWEYKSTNIADPPQVSEVSEVQGLVPTSSIVTLFPKKRHHIFKPNGNNVQESGCHICNKTATKSMWLGYGHKNNLTGRGLQLLGASVVCWSLL